MDLMIDLKTLGTGPRAVVMQLGAVAFRPAPEVGTGLHNAPYGTPSGFEICVGADSCIALGGTITAATIDWWFRQPDETRRAIMEGPRRSIRDAIQNLFFFYESNNCGAVWSHGAAFDVVIVEHYARELGLRVPWNYADVRDTRTLFSAAAQLGWEKPKRQVAHAARADAEAQALEVQHAFDFLVGLKERAVRERLPIPYPVDPYRKVRAAMDEANQAAEREGVDDKEYARIATRLMLNPSSPKS